MAVAPLLAAAGPALSAASTAFAIFGSIQSFMTAQDNANAQAKAQEQRNDALIEQTIANYDELSDIERQSQEKAFDESIGVQKDYLKEKGRVNVMAAALGTGGQSLGTQLQDLESQKYSNYDTILQNRQGELDNIRSQAETLRYQARANMDITPISRPSWAKAVVDIGSTAIGGYTDYKAEVGKAKPLTGSRPEIRDISIQSGG